MPPEFSEAALEEAHAAIKLSKSHRPSKGEQRLEKLDNIGSILSSDTTSDAFSLVKDGISNFEENSKLLISVLDEVAKVHPFIQVAVSVFKAGLNLELTRRENDDKVLTLNLTMCDMMETLILLKQTVNSEQPGADGPSIEDRLKTRMGAIVDTIKRCAKVCDTYQKRRTAVKLFMSSKWQGTFAEVAQQFAEHKSGIQFDLQLHISGKLGNANAMLVEMKTTMSQVKENITELMKTIFERLCTPEERELSERLASQGGADVVLKNDRLLGEILKQQKTPKGNKQQTATELQKEVEKGVDQILAEEKFFNSKFDAMLKQMEEDRGTIKRESDRVINAVLSGPHERIVDRDMYHIWKEMGWKGSVKAKHLAMALRDHFAEGSDAAALAAIHDITTTTKSDSDSAAQTVEKIAEIARSAESSSMEDKWTMQFITVGRLQPIMEALDDDASSLVTVAEVNAFTAARPFNWSLPRWIAFWAYGFEMAVQWYFRRIRKLFADISAASQFALKTNRGVIARFITSWEILLVENFLSGLRDTDEWDDTDWNLDATFLKFKDYIIENEMGMDRRLRAVNYIIDEVNTLTMVTGAVRLEKYILPILFLLFRRSLAIISLAKTAKLHPEELGEIQYSIMILMEEVARRAHTMQAVYKLQNLNEKEQRNKFFFGLFSSVTETAVMGPYWARNPRFEITVFDIEPTDESATLETGENQLLFGPQTEELELLAGSLTGQSESQNNEASGTQSLIGGWGGSYTYHDGEERDDGLVSFTVSSHDSEGSFIGSGIDVYGPFTVQGTLNDHHIVFEKAYILLQYGRKVAWRYEGRVNAGFNEITGEWGRSSVKSESDVGEDNVDGKSNDIGTEEGSNIDHGDDNAETDSVSEAGSSIATDIALGGFSIKRRSMEYLLSCPSAEEFKQNRPRALWKLAINSTIYSIRSHTLSWKVLSARRHQRQRYIELVRIQQKTGDITPNSEDMNDCFGCDSCHRDILASSRFQCVSCSEGEITRTLDLCKDCFFEQKPVTRRNDKSHSLSHNMIQWRSAVLPSYCNSMYSWAKDALNYISVYLSQGDSEGLPCVECAKKIQAQPYWCCLDCRQNLTLVCFECNERVEQQKPWMENNQICSSENSSGHNWSHTLVSAPLEKDETVEANVSVETRLERLEDKFDKIDARLVKLEELLSRLGRTE
ncbi:hypothetical protein D9758_014525 [Tetrapyrgos nigripes]|uniref:Uncharacterized protein n=1 Tax=Tetrapyrgos nigripes TaxID=182062 RepID=A0A8H5FSH4_9AGAR|nr:hypothetical protein D9758_014525 [Tetrapyrgos nigripes]